MVSKFSFYLLIVLIFCVLQTLAIDIHLYTWVQKRVNTACINVDGCDWSCHAMSTTGKKALYTPPQCAPANNPIPKLYVYGTSDTPYIVVPNVPGKTSCQFYPSRLHVFKNFICSYFSTAPPFPQPVSPAPIVVGGKAA